MAEIEAFIRDRGLSVLMMSDVTEMKEAILYTPRNEQQTSCTQLEDKACCIVGVSLETW